MNRPSADPPRIALLLVAGEVPLSGTTVRYERIHDLEGLKLVVNRPAADENGMISVTGEELFDNFIEHGIYQPYVPVQITPTIPAPPVEPTPVDDEVELRRELFAVALAFRLEGGCFALFDENQRTPVFLLAQDEGFVAVRHVGGRRLMTLDLPTHPTYLVQSIALTPATPGDILDALIDEVK